MFKTLWVVDYGDLSKFSELAVTIGASAVAIRTSSDVSAVIDPFHSLGIQVIGWRWPSAQRVDALAEAKKAAKLFDAGMDGYIVDPEGDKGKPWDWNQDGLEQLAADFCATVSGAAGDRLFGVTSHYRGSSTYPRLPWTQFLARSTATFPQAYWRVAGGRVGAGVPGVNYDESLTSWAAMGATREAIVPMAGELAVVTSSEIDEYVATAQARLVSQLHFYGHKSTVDENVWAAIAVA